MKALGWFAGLRVCRLVVCLSKPTFGELRLRKIYSQHGFLLGWRRALSFRVACVKLLWKQLEWDRLFWVFRADQILIPPALGVIYHHGLVKQPNKNPYWQYIFLNLISPVCVLIAQQIFWSAQVHTDLVSPRLY